MDPASTERNLRGTADKTLNAAIDSKLVPQAIMQLENNRTVGQLNIVRRVSSNAPAGMRIRAKPELLSHLDQSSKFSGIANRIQICHGTRARIAIVRSTEKSALDDNEPQAPDSRLGQDLIERQ